MTDDTLSEHDEQSAFLRRITSGEIDTCSRCGGRPFHAVPQQTTPEEITAFAQSATFPGAEEVAKDGWIHPGVFCPQGCNRVLFNYGPPVSNTSTGPAWGTGHPTEGGVASPAPDVPPRDTCHYHVMLEK